MTRPSIYHTVVLLLTLFCVLAPAAGAVESKRLTDVWPVGKKQQFLYMYEGNVIGEQWVELREVPRSATPRYQLVNTIDVDGVPYGSNWKSWGQSVCELDEWGRPIAYDMEVFGPASDNVRRVRAEVNYPQVDFFISVNDGEETSYSQPATPEARYVDLIFVGPYDLAFRLQPFTPQSTKLVRDWIVPNMNFAMQAEVDVLYEETVVLPDGTEYPTVRVASAPLLVDLWIAPGGKLVKAEIANPPTTVLAGKTIMPGDDDTEERAGP